MENKNWRPFHPSLSIGFVELLFFDYDSIIFCLADSQISYVFFSEQQRLLGLYFAFCIPYGRMEIENSKRRRKNEEKNVMH